MKRPKATKAPAQGALPLPEKTDKTPKRHAGDLADEADEARAIGYAVAFNKSPFEKFREECDTLDEAYAIARRLNTEHGKNGRRACIYAVLPGAAMNRAVPIRNQEPPET